MCRCVRVCAPVCVCVWEGCVGVGVGGCHSHIHMCAPTMSYTFNCQVQWIPLFTEQSCGGSQPTVKSPENDRACRGGSGDEQSDNSISYSEKKNIIRAVSMPGPCGDDYHLLSKEQQVALVRLRTSHNRLNVHMYRNVKLVPSPICPCGPEDQTMKHILQRCPIHQRQDV